MSNLIAAAKARNIDLGDARVEVDGHTEASPARFDRIVMRVFLPDVGREESEHLIEIARRSCIATNTLSRGTDLEVEVETGGGARRG